MDSTECLARANPGNNLTNRPNDEPEPALCECGRVWAWVPWPTERSRYYGRVPVRMTRPAINPCSVCKPEREREERQKAHARRQKAAGVPKKLRPYRWERARVQDADEPVDAFVRDTKTRLGTLGILRSNVAAARDLASWTPDSGYSIYVYGKVGTGKSLYSAATASRLLEATEPKKEVIPIDTLARLFGEDKCAAAVDAARDYYYKGGKTWDVLVSTHSDLVRRVMLGWERDRAPLAQVTDVSALIIDDLGSIGHDPGKGGKQPPQAIESIQRLIPSRYDAGRNLIITSNVPFEELLSSSGGLKIAGIKGWFGERVYSRLREMTEGHRYRLHGPDWRWL